MKRDFAPKSFTRTAILTSAFALLSFPLMADSLDSEYSEEAQIAACVAGDQTVPRVLVDVSGIASDEGTLRVQIYGDDPDDFLVSGKKVTRVDVPTLAGQQKVCVTFPNAGEFAMAVMHDKNANGKADIFTEGFGFSNNPSLTFGPPDHEEADFRVEDGVKEMDIELTYYFQLENKDQKRRRRR